MNTQTSRPVTVTRPALSLRTHVRAGVPTSSLIGTIGPELSTGTRSSGLPTGYFSPNRG